MLMAFWLHMMVSGIGGGSSSGFVRQPTCSPYGFAADVVNCMFSGARKQARHVATWVQGGGGGWGAFDVRVPRVDSVVRSRSTRTAIAGGNGAPPCARHEAKLVRIVCECVCVSARAAIRHMRKHTLTRMRNVVWIYPHLGIIHSTAAWAWAGRRGGRTISARTRTRPEYKSAKHFDYTHMRPIQTNSRIYIFIYVCAVCQRVAQNTHPSNSGAAPPPAKCQTTLSTDVSKLE